MAKLGLLDLSFAEMDEVSVGCEEPFVSKADMVQVVLGNATPVFNNLNESKVFYFFVKDLSGYLVASIIQAIDNNNKLVRDNVNERNFSRKVANKETVKLELWKCFNPKGPPLTC